MDKRHKKRIEIVQGLYKSLFTTTKKNSTIVDEILRNEKTIDEKIKSAAPKYEITKIAKVDLSILRLAVYELTIEKKQPTKVIINEAIELAKELASSKSPAFVNAVLGNIVDHG